ncbi:hypothetical protein [Pseudomonas lijiangensis]|uniref:Uncharacterized protein n=1 Tax=Pseudomonas lijiangensis TaxID=2995658 RepID=A0ABX8HV86_9PSED|nr:MULTISPECIES: hypothetical protein [Pseudomonas syringae group]MBX8502992.1 hypothetical protein [Pseudomonas lijiangensis]MBX8505149.1 hypothetical protein [Pseudomonas lijiangensis]MBX8555745.1 hypothetical protein [Pseudomonas cichorii]QWU84511.1 hypothetical protein KQP88_07035 [Pseudomonas lijiangensis]
MSKLKKKAVRLDRVKVKLKREREQRLRSYYAQIGSMHKDPVVISVKAAVAYFKSFMTIDQWARRKAGVIEYFSGITKTMLQAPTKDSGELNNRMAYFAKWIDWYVYLADVCTTKAFGHDEAQWSRILPFFKKIGDSLDLLAEVRGSAQRVKEMLHGNDNNADSVLFELIVAIAYAEKGWEVEFIPECKGSKTPDFKAVRYGETVFVECKRLQKVTDYSEEERSAWLKQWKVLVPEMIQIGHPVIAYVTFKTEVASLRPDLVADLFKSAFERKVGYVSSDDCDLRLRPIDFPSLWKHLSKYSVKFPSAQLNALLDPSWAPHASYTMVMNAKFKLMREDNSVLNRFVEEIGSVYCARWECVAEASINKKSRDVRSLLTKAVSQAPADAKTVVHIAYETLHGPEVEFVRDNKIQGLLREFDYGEKDIACVFCHAMQPAAFPQGIVEIAETARFFNRSLKAEDLLPGHQLLFGGGEGVKVTFNDTHWMQDVRNGAIHEVF